MLKKNSYLTKESMCDIYKIFGMLYLTVLVIWMTSSPILGYNYAFELFIGPTIILLMLRVNEKMMLKWITRNGSISYAERLGAHIMLKAISRVLFYLSLFTIINSISYLLTIHISHLTKILFIFLAWTRIHKIIMEYEIELSNLLIYDLRELLREK